MDFLRRVRPASWPPTPAQNPEPVPRPGQRQMRMHTNRILCRHTHPVPRDLPIGTHADTHTHTHMRSPVALTLLAHTHSQNSSQEPLLGKACGQTRGGSECQGEGGSGPRAEVTGCVLPLYSPCRPISGTASIFVGPVAVNRNRQAEWHLFVPLFPY